MAKKRTTIGKMSNSRMMWAIKPVTRIQKGKKGKGTYNRQKMKQETKNLSKMFL